MIEIIFTTFVYLAGAITEYESKGKVTNVIYYSDVNSSKRVYQKRQGVMMITESTTLSVYGKILFNFFTVCVGGMFTYLGLNGEAFFLFSVLLIIDYMTGVAKAYRLGHCITSNKMKYGMLSKLSLLLIPVVLAIGAKAVGADFKTVLMVGINILVLSEIYSIIGNIYSIRTKDELPEYDVVAMLGRRIRTVLIRYSEEGNV